MTSTTSMEVVVVVLTTAICLVASFQAQASKSSYVGAVVEYSPVYRINEHEMVLENVKNYEKLMGEAKSKGADIIVFPETGLCTKSLATQVPHPSQKATPCNEPGLFDEVLVKLSCGSKNNRIYSVVNLLERRNCTKDDEDCPKRGYFKYNTNVAFDRNGTVVARYAKYNLYDEFDKDKPKTFEMSFFETDFGVRFGTFICFDILFAEPGLRLIEQYGITDFAMTTFWFSELPFLTAVQTQQGWAESNDVNLLVSGYDLPKIGSFGSGIYNGKFGALTAISPEVNTTKVLVATVPKKQRRDFDLDLDSSSYLKEKDSHFEKSTTAIEGIVFENENQTPNMLLGKDQMHLFKTKVIENNKVFKESVCTNDFCCEFRVSTTVMNASTKYYYRAVVMDSVRKFGISTAGGVQVCGVIVCNGPDIKNCSSRVPDVTGQIRIDDIEIKGKQFELFNSFHMASTLTDRKKLFPLPTKKYLFEKKNLEDSKEIRMKLLWPVDDLTTFAIWGRVFKRDGGDIIVSKASFVTSVSGLLLSFFIFLFVAR